MNQLLARYIPCVSFWAPCSVAQTEIALHDVEDPAHSLVKLVLPYVSGRREGAPLPTTWPSSSSIPTNTAI